MSERQSWDVNPELSYSKVNVLKHHVTLPPLYDIKMHSGFNFEVETFYKFCIMEISAMDTML